MKRAKYAAIFIISIIYIFCFGAECFAGLNGGGSGGSSHDDGGAYDESQVALRFSLIDKDGNTLDSIDIYNSYDPFNRSDPLRIRIKNRCCEPHTCAHAEDFLPFSSMQYIFKGSKSDVIKYGLGDSSLSGLNYTTWNNIGCSELQNPIRLSGDTFYNTLTDGSLYIDYLKEKFTQADDYGQRLNAVFSVLSPLSSYEPTKRFKEFSKRRYTLMIEPVLYTVFNTDGRADGSQNLILNQDVLCSYCCDSMFYGTVTEMAMFIEKTANGYYLGRFMNKDDFGGRSVNSVLSLEAQALYIKDKPINDKLGLKKYSGTYNYKSLIESMGVITFDYTSYAALASKGVDYDYRTDTNVITSVPIKNISRINDLKPTNSEYLNAKREKRQPIGIKAKLIISRNEEMTDILTDTEQEELGIPEYISTEGLPKKNEDGIEASSYLYFKWKTPSAPQTLYIGFAYMDCQNNPVEVNPYEDGVEMPERIQLNFDRDNNGIRDGLEEYCYYSCKCVISDTMETIRTDKQPPDPISGFFNKPSEKASSAEKENYRKNIDAYKTFDISKSFDINGYYPNDFPKSLSWTEYTVSLNNITMDAEFTSKEYIANSLLSEQVNLEPIYLFDSTPQRDITIFGENIKSILSGYGFSLFFKEEYADNGDEEYMNKIINSCTLFHNGIVLFPEFNYSSDKIMTIETKYNYDGDENTFDCLHVLAENPYSLYSGKPVDDIVSEADIKNRVHFTPIWYPDNSSYDIEIIMFDYWTPAGQLYDHNTYSIHIDGNLYDNWYAAKSGKNQKK